MVTFHMNFKIALHFNFTNRFLLDEQGNKTTCHFTSSRRFFTSWAGGHSMSLGLCPTKLPMTWDTRVGHSGVPAMWLWKTWWSCWNIGHEGWISFSQAVCFTIKKRGTSSFMTSARDALVFVQVCVSSCVRHLRQYYRWLANQTTGICWEMLRASSKSAARLALRYCSNQCKPTVVQFPRFWCRQRPVKRKAKLSMVTRPICKSHNQMTSTIINTSFNRSPFSRDPQQERCTLVLARFKSTSFLLEWKAWMSPWTFVWSRCSFDRLGHHFWKTPMSPVVKLSAVMLLANILAI